MTGDLAAPEDCRVEVVTADLLSAFDALAAAQKAGTVLKVSMEGSDLVCTRGRTSVRVPAIGWWPLTADMRVQVINGLRRQRKELPATLVLSSKLGFLRIGNLRLACRWALPDARGSGHVVPKVKVRRMHADKSWVFSGVDVETLNGVEYFTLFWHDPSGSSHFGHSEHFTAEEYRSYLTEQGKSDAEIAEHMDAARAHAAARRARGAASEKGLPEEHRPE